MDIQERPLIPRTIPGPLEVKKNFVCPVIPEIRADSPFLPSISLPIDRSGTKVEKSHSAARYKRTMCPMNGPDGRRDRIFLSETKDGVVCSGDRNNYSLPTVERHPLHVNTSINSRVPSLPLYPRPLYPALHSDHSRATVTGPSRCFPPST